jgi:hypothetical protein
VLCKVRESALGRSLVPASDPYPELEGNYLALAILVDDEPDSIRQNFSRG